MIPEEAFKEKKRRYPRLRKHFNRIEGFDVLHANTLEELAEHRGWQRGDLLFCVRNLNLIGILDIEEECVIWTWGTGILDRPHHPTVLESGNILVFDNGTRTREYSRIIELNPATKEIAGSTRATRPRHLFEA